MHQAVMHSMQLYTLAHLLTIRDDDQRQGDEGEEVKDRKMSEGKSVWGGEEEERRKRRRNRGWVMKLME